MQASDILSLALQRLALGRTFSRVCVVTLNTARVPVFDSAFTRPRFATVTYYAYGARTCWVPADTLLLFDGAPLASHAAVAWHLEHALAHNQALFGGPNAYALGAIEEKVGSGPWVFWRRNHG